MPTWLVKKRVTLVGQFPQSSKWSLKLGVGASFWCQMPFMMQTSAISGFLLFIMPQNNS